MVTAALIISLVGFVVFAFRVVFRLFSFEKKVRPLDLNVSAIFLAAVILSFGVLVATGYRDDKRAEETRTLLAVERIQRKILRDEGYFGQKPDVLRRSPVLFKLDFEVITGMDGSTVMLKTPRCEMALFPRSSLGPTCGAK